MLEADAAVSLDRFRTPGDLTLSRRATAILALFGASMLLVGLGTSRVLTYHEVVFAEPAKEMLASGNWTLPTLGGVAFNDKPPGTAWAIAACMAISGSQSEWVVRLPSVLSAIATAWFVAWLAARWFGGTCGLIAGLVELSTVHVMMYGRLGECDIVLAAAMAGAMAVWGAAHVDGPGGRLNRRWTPWLFYAALMVSFFIKGLVGPVFILGGCIGFALLRREARQIKFLLNPIGLAIFLVPIVVWFVCAYQQHPQIVDDMLRHHLGRFQGEMGRHEPRWAYFYLVPMMMLPWTPLVFMALARGARSGWLRDDRWQFLACWFVPGMMLLSWSAFKSKHYTIPLLAPLSMLAAQGLLDHVARRARSLRPMRGWLAAATVVGCLAAIILVERGRTKNPHEIAALIGLLGIGLLATIELERRRRLAAELVAVFATAWAVSVGAQLRIVPHHDTYLPQAELAGRIQQIVPPERSIYMLLLPENQITYYLDRPVVRLDDPRQFPQRAAADAAAELFVLAPRHIAETLVAAGEARVLDRCTYLNSYMTERDRLTFLTWKRPAAAQAVVGGQLNRK